MIGLQIKALEAGLSVAILPGGEHEQLLVCPDESPYEDIVAPRDGLFRLAVSLSDWLMHVPVLICYVV